MLFCQFCIPVPPHPRRYLSYDKLQNREDNSQKDHESGRPEWFKVAIVLAVDEDDAEND